MSNRYKNNRRLANKINAKIRKVIKKTTGVKVPKRIEIDEIIPIKKGGSPISLANKRLVTRRVNRKKGAR